VDPSAGVGNQHYIQPDLSACAKNYNVLLSDGRAGGNDNQTETLTPLLPGFSTVTGRSSCDDVVSSEDDGICIDDIAEYLFKTDISPDATGLAGQQNVIMHTVGFAVDTENLQMAALITRPTTGRSLRQRFSRSSPRSPTGTCRSWRRRFR
jgi:hypothetical protein